MSRTRRFLGGLGVGYASQAVMTLVGLWLVQFLLDQLGRELYGLWLVAGQFLGYVALLDLGVVALLPRETAWATGRGEPVAPVLARALRVVLWQTPAVALLSAALWFLLPADWAALRGPLGIVLLAFAVTFPLRTFEAALRGLQDLAWIGGANFTTWLLNTATVVALLLTTDLGLYALAAGWIVGRVTLGAAALVRLRRRFPETLPRSLPAARAAAVAVFRRSVWISVSQVAHALLTATDLILIGAILGPVATVAYAITGKLITTLAHYPQTIVDAAAPGVSEVRAAESRERTRQVAEALMEALLLFSGLLVCVVLAVNEGFVIWWVGAENWGGMLLSVLILARVLTGHFVLALELALFAFGYERRLAVASLVNGAVTVVASVLLIRGIGVEGAVVAALLGLVVVSGPAYLALYARETAAPVSRVFQALWPWGWRFALSAAVAGFVIAPRMRPDLPVLAAGAAVTAVLYVLMVVPRLTAPPLSLYLHPRVVAAARRLTGQRP